MSAIDDYRKLVKRNDAIREAFGRIHDWLPELSVVRRPYTEGLAEAVREVLGSDQAAAALTAILDQAEGSARLAAEREAREFMGGQGG